VINDPFVSSPLHSSVSFFVVFLGHGWGGGVAEILFHIAHAGTRTQFHRRAGLQQGPILPTLTLWSSPASDHYHSSDFSRLSPFLELARTVLLPRTSSDCPHSLELPRNVLIPRTSRDCSRSSNFPGLFSFRELLWTVLILQFSYV
jgi:hypothetical protein